MSKSQTYIFVLWGDQFEEAVATIFITELRQAGLRVKVVGLSRRHSSGAHGLALVPDLTLEEILPLADQTRCVIIPCNATSLKRLEDEPRLHEFFAQAGANGALFVTGPQTVRLLPAADGNLIVYPANEALVTFARTVAEQLS